MSNYRSNGSNSKMEPEDGHGSAHQGNQREAGGMLLTILNSMNMYASVFHAYADTMRPVIVVC